MLLAADADELHVVLGVQGLDCGLCLRRELGDERAILDRVVLRHRAANRDALRVHHDNALDSLVRVDAVDSLLHFLGLIPRLCHVQMMLTIYIYFEFNLFILENITHTNTRTRTHKVFNTHSFLKPIKPSALIIPCFLGLLTDLEAKMT